MKIAKLAKKLQVKTEQGAQRGKKMKIVKLSKKAGLSCTGRAFC